MNRPSSILILSAALTTTAFAGTKSEDLALKLLIAHKDAEAYDECALAIADKYIKNMGTPEHMTPEQEKLYPIITSKIRKVFLQKLGWAAQKDGLIKAYAETYTIEEMNSLIAFYESDLGKSISSKTKTISLKCMEVYSKSQHNINAAIEAELSRK